MVRVTIQAVAGVLPAGDGEADAHTRRDGTDKRVNEVRQMPLTNVPVAVVALKLGCLRLAFSS